MPHNITELNTWVAYSQHVFKQTPQGPMAVFSIPIHADLKALLRNPQANGIRVEVRIKKGMKIARIKNGANIRLKEVQIVEAPRSQYLKAQTIEFLDAEGFAAIKPRGKQLELAF